MQGLSNAVYRLQVESYFMGHNKFSKQTQQCLLKNIIYLRFADISNRSAGSGQVKLQ